MRRYNAAPGDTMLLAQGLRYHREDRVRAHGNQTLEFH